MQAYTEAQLQAYVGACVARTWRDNWYDAENKKRNPVAYRVSEG